MRYTLTSPCSECPFLLSYEGAFSEQRLDEFASGVFHCHKTGEWVEDEEGYGEGAVPTDSSLACAGALIFCEKRGQPNQMMRIAERLGLYDRTRLNLSAPVR